MSLKRSVRVAADYATFEHITRKRDGGKHGQNVVLAHARCNLGREGVHMPHWEVAKD